MLSLVTILRTPITRLPRFRLLNLIYAEPNDGLAWKVNFIQILFLTKNVNLI